MQILPCLSIFSDPSGISHAPSALTSMLKNVAFLSLACLFSYGISLTVVYLLFSDNLPDIDELELFQPKRITKVYSADGQHLRNFKEENREVLRGYEEIPQAMKDALTSIEDRRFFTHWGVDLRRVIGAILANVRALNMTAEGASTLTQQLARNLYEKVGTQRGSASLEQTVASYARKIREQITAVHIERLYTKREILTMYLNTVFFGHGLHGLKLAARYYFDEDVEKLSITQSAVLAGLLKAPNNYSPFSHPEDARKRRNLVLKEMWQSGKIAISQHTRLSKAPIRTRRSQRAETYDLAPYFVEYVRQQLTSEYGRALYRNGFTVHTTLHSKLQQIADKHFAIEIGKVQARVDARLAAKNVSQGMRDSAVVQAAFVAMDPASGKILAMIGGRDFGESEFNRATQAKRHPGSAFKPFVYTAALDNGRFTIDVIDDNAIVIPERSGEIWDPENYDHKFKGPMTLREGFKQSRNLIAIKLAQEIGPQRIRQYAMTMGIDTPIRPVWSIGIGTSEVTLLNMLAAYCVFPNAGVYVEPSVVARIEDSDGNVISEPVTVASEVLRPSVAVLMTDLMRSVIHESGGTGHRVETVYGFRTASAGKTGTTNDYTDAWFIGFTPHLVAGVWVGMDDPRLNLEKQPGATAALPLWARFMKEVYKTVEPYRSRAGDSFEFPEDLTSRLMACEDTHKLATKYCPNQKPEIFIADGVLPGSCPLHSVGDGGPGRRSHRF